MSESALFDGVSNITRLPLPSPIARGSFEAGQSVSRALRAAWRGSLGSSGLEDGSEQLRPSQMRKIAPLLIWTGSGALAWWRWRESGCLDTTTRETLRQVYLIHSTRAAYAEQDLKSAVTALRENGIEPLLGKGWAVARLYPETGLRPYGDIDLCVPFGQRAIAEKVLAKQQLLFCQIDLHDSFSDLSDRAIDALYARSKLVELDGVKVRVLSLEDQLRLTSLHLLRHGGWRPSWFCDIGVILDQLPMDFDWSYFYQGKRKHTDWVLAVLKLTHQLLAGKDPEQLSGRRTDPLPKWLSRAVLRQWGAVYQHRDPPIQAVGWEGLPTALLHRWPDPIEATITWQGSVNHWPRLPFQLLEFSSRLINFGVRVLGKRLSFTLR